MSSPDRPRPRKIGDRTVGILALASLFIVSGGIILEPLKPIIDLFDPNPAAGAYTPSSYDAFRRRTEALKGEVPPNRRDMKRRALIVRAEELDHFAEGVKARNPNPNAATIHLVEAAKLKELAEKYDGTWDIEGSLVFTAPQPK